MLEPFAVPQDYIDYVGSSDKTPEDLERLLLRASDLISYMTLNQIDPNNERHLEAAKLATCAQVEYWTLVSETSSIAGHNIGGFSIGDLSVNFGSSGSGGGGIEGLSGLSIRSRMYLNSQGLLNRGVRYR